MRSHACMCRCTCLFACYRALDYSAYAAQTSIWVHSARQLDDFTCRTLKHRFIAQCTTSHCKAPAPLPVLVFARCCYAAVAPPASQAEVALHLAGRVAQRLELEVAGAAGGTCQVYVLHGRVLPPALARTSEYVAIGVDGTICAVLLACVWPRALSTLQLPAVHAFDGALHGRPIGAPGSARSSPHRCWHWPRPARGRRAGSK